MEKARILVVEDEAIVAMDIADTLRNIGHEVTDTMPSGKQAIASVKENRPDVILMDIGLKGEMDGIQTAEQIRSQYSIPVIFLTAYADEKTLERAKIAAPCGYLTKPFEETDLRIAIEVGLYRAKLESEREALIKELASSAAHDDLTGLPNKTLLCDRFDIALAHAQRKNTRLAIMSLDLDRFKTVNDTLGHSVGDKLLISVASRLTRMVRKGDTVSRIGGDEFVLLLWEVDHKDNAIKIAQKLLDNFRQPFIIDEHRLNITVSIGVALYPEDGKDLEVLLKNSDDSLYRAKEDGRDSFRLHSGVTIPSKSS